VNKHKIFFVHGVGGDAGDWLRKMRGTVIDCHVEHPRGVITA
jgi:hypothetical protein